MRFSKPSPRKRVNDSRSRTWYSICSSDRLYKDCKTNIRNNTSASIGLRPALLFLASSAVSTTASMSPRNFSHGTSALIETNGSPFADSIDKRLSASKNPICDIQNSRKLITSGGRLAHIRRQCYFSRCPKDASARRAGQVGHQPWIAVESDACAVDCRLRMRAADDGID